MAASVRVQLSSTVMNQLLNSESGPVGEYILSKIIQGERHSKRLVNVDTGRLRSSITHVMGVDYDGLYGAWGTNVEYAIPQEFLPPPRGKAYLRPAIEMIS